MHVHSIILVSEFKIARQEEPFRELNLRSSNLKKILSRIPDEIDNRRKFLDTIKYVFYVPIAHAAQ